MARTPCAACGTALLWGGVEHAGRRYCSAQCRDFATTPTFCQACLDETVAVAGKRAFVGLAPLPLGFVPLGKADRCEHCASVLQTRWFFVVFPLLVWRTHRVKWVTTGRFIERELNGRRFDAGQVLRTAAVSIAGLVAVLWLGTL